jgi:NAD(P)H dehydrogenase (quinone)
MNILVILAHPNPESFNHAIAQRIVATLKRERHNVLFHDLYAEKFDPLLSVDEIKNDRLADPKLQCYCNELTGADGLIFVHPNWWGQPPAILTGWIDRVFRSGIAYAFNEGDHGEGVPIGLLTGKTALVFNTSDTPGRREQEVFGDPLDLIWKKCLFEFCGIERYHRKVFSVIVNSTKEQRIRWLEEAEEVTRTCFN